MEVRSLEVENMYELGRNVAMVVKISREDVEGYEFKMEKYRDGKMGIREKEREEEWLMLWKDDGMVRKEVGK